MVAAGVSWLCRPHDPSWDLIQLDIDADAFASAIMGLVPPTRPLSLYAHVNFLNPNIIGAKAGASTVAVHHGNSTDGDVICKGSTTPIDIAPHAIGRVGVDMSVSLTDKLSLAIAEEMLANDMRLRVFADAHTVADLGPLSINVHVQCKLAVTLALLKDPAKVIDEKDCTYTYRL